MAHVEHSSKGFERTRETSRDLGKHESGSKDAHPESADSSRDR